jgi:flagellar P-ring protein precursor FlgI
MKIMARQRNSRILTAILLISSIGAMLLPGPVWAARIKDISRIQGYRPNQLIGYGIVVGLKETGDSSQVGFTSQSLMAFLARMGVRVDLKDINVRNVAAVTITAELPPLARPGMRLDLTVSSIGNAKSLEGGVLLLTPLKAVDGNIYAMAQGNISVGGYKVQASGSSVVKNHTTVGRIVGGGLVEANVPFSLTSCDQSEIILLLNRPDFTTAVTMADKINVILAAEEESKDPDGFKLDRNNGKHFKSWAEDGGVVKISIPERYQHRIPEMIARVEQIEIEQDTVAKVILNEKTGTIVMGENVRISTVAIAHGNIHIEVTSMMSASQPAPLSNGKTVLIQNADIAVQEEKSKMNVIKSGISIGELVNGLNALGATPRDLIVILQMIKAAGAMDAEIDIL